MVHLGEAENVLKEFQLTIPNGIFTKINQDGNKEKYMLIEEQLMNTVKIENQEKCKKGVIAKADSMVF